MLANLRATYQWHGYSVAVVLAAAAEAVLVAHNPLKLVLGSCTAEKIKYTA
jgi:hypothetical protein